MLDKIKELVLSYTAENIELALTIGLNLPNITTDELVLAIKETIQNNKDICITELDNPKGETIISGNNLVVNGVYWSGLSFYYANEGNDCIEETIVKTLSTLPRC